MHCFIVFPFFSSICRMQNIWSVVDLLRRNPHWWCPMGKTLTNQNSIQEEIKSRLNSGNACYHSVQNLLSSSLQSKNLKIKIYRTKILPVVFMDVKLGDPHWGRNVGWGCLRTDYWGEYLDPTGAR